MKKILFIVLVAWVYDLPLQGQSIEFNRENVTFQLDSLHFLVTADLYLKNPINQEKTSTVFFPFSCEGHIVKVDSVTILDLSNSSQIRPARRNLAGVLFSVNYGPQETKKIRVIYSQDHDGKLAGYVLTKVKYWQGHLAQANYTLKVISPSIVVDSTAYKTNLMSEENGNRIYKWNENNFIPDKEFCVHFHVNKKK